MRVITATAVSSLAAFVCMTACPLRAAPPGSLVIVGGGGTPEPVVRRMLELAGGSDASIAILPQASDSDGQAAVEMFRTAGAKRVQAVLLTDNEQAVSRIREAQLIWFPGGQQSRLLRSLGDSDVIDLIRQRHAHGAIVGGTSAGAAAMSEVMIPRAPEKQALAVGNTPISVGLGLAPGLIIDQHFVARERMNRLLSAVIDHPDRLGVGIGERTAIVVTTNRFEVLGEGSVVVIDPRGATTGRAEPGALQSAQDIRLDVLRAGDTYRIDRIKRD